MNGSPNESLIVYELFPESFFLDEPSLGNILRSATNFCLLLDSYMCVRAHAQSFTFGHIKLNTYMYDF